ncbi:serine hydrolase domain-containing protein [soil metagenome]
MTDIGTISQLRMDRRALLAGLGALTLPSSVLAAPKDYPALQAFLTEYADGKKLANCVVAIKRGNKKVEYFSRGTIALDSPTKADENSIYRIYSMSKPITGAAFMSLVEKGVLRLDQPLSDILPEFKDQKVMLDGKLENTRPVKSPILMRHLITHTSGLSYGINGAAPLAQAYNRYGLGAGGRQVAATLSRPTDLYPPARDLETFGRRLATLPLDFDPGTKWQYSVGLDLMGLVIQRASGMPFFDYLKQAIFDPLGMNDTDFVVPSSKLDRLTSVYAGRGGSLSVSDDRKTSPFHTDRDLPSGGGGLTSTTKDYARFNAMLLGEGALDKVRILKPETVRIARSNLMPAGVFQSLGGTAPAGFGAAMQVLLAKGAGGDPAGTYGWDGAAGTTMWVDPVNMVTCVVMVQIMGGTNIHNPSRVAAYADLAKMGAVKA